MEETIELKDIIKIILKGRKLIIGTTAVFLILSTILTWFIIPEKYESEAIVQVVSNVQDTGVITDYVNSEFTPTIYSQRVQNEFRMNAAFEEAGMKEFNIDNVSVTLDNQTGLVNLSYTSEYPEQSQKELWFLMEEVKMQMNSSIQNTLVSLEQTYFNESNNLAIEVESLMEQYNEIIISNNLPEVLILQTLSTSQFVLDLNERQTDALSSITGNLQNKLAQLKAEIDIKSQEYRNVLTNYQSVKTGLEGFKPDPFVRVIVDPTLPENPSSPNKLLNLAIAIGLGLMISLGIVFFREYWNVSEVEK